MNDDLVARTLVTRDWLTVRLGGQSVISFVAKP
jgi:hypothetical protein